MLMASHASTQCAPAGRTTAREVVFPVSPATSAPRRACRSAPRATTARLAPAPPRARAPALRAPTPLQVNRSALPAQREPSAPSPPPAPRCAALTPFPPQRVLPLPLPAYPARLAPSPYPAPQYVRARSTPLELATAARSSPTGPQTPTTFLQAALNPALYSLLLGLSVPLFITMGATGLESAAACGWALRCFLPAGRFTAHTFLLRTRP